MTENVRLEHPVIVQESSGRWRILVWGVVFRNRKLIWTHSNETRDGLWPEYAEFLQRANRRERDIKQLFRPGG